MTTDGGMRLECPACLGVRMEKAAVAPGLAIDHCNRCGGNWILQADAPRLVAHSREAARAALSARSEFSFLCHGCHAPMKRNAPSCRACGWSNLLDCPGCGGRMPRKLSQGAVVDACGSCRGVWLDEPELATLWTAAAGALLVANSGGYSGAADAGLHAADALLEAVYYAPDLVVGVARVSGHAISTGIDVAANLPDAVSALPHVLGSLLEGAGELAGAVFELIVEILGGLLDGM